MPGDTPPSREMEEIAKQEAKKELLKKLASRVSNLHADDSDLFLARGALGRLEEELDRHSGGRRVAGDLDDFRSRFSGLRTELEELSDQIFATKRQFEDSETDTGKSLNVLQERVEEIESHVRTLAGQAEDELIPTLKRFAGSLEGSGDYSSSDEIRRHTGRLDEHMQEIATNVRRIKTELNEQIERTT